MAAYNIYSNIIPCNAIGAGLVGGPYFAPPRDRLTAFVDLLRTHDVVEHLREPRGDDINAACGQLREMA